ncbi:hypothetical protein Tco_1226511 [Tanacetum coccineum]
MKNRFDIFLSDENVNEETNEGDQVKILIKRACDMGIPISDDDLKDWPLDMVDLYYDMWKKRSTQFLSPKQNAARKAYKAERKKIVDLEWERRRAEVDLFLVSKDVMTDNIRDVWTDDMMEYYMDINVTKDEQMKEMEELESRKGCRIIVGWDRNVIGVNLISQTDQVMVSYSVGYMGSGSEYTKVSVRFSLSVDINLDKSFSGYAFSLIQKFSDFKVCCSASQGSGHTEN